MAKVLFAQKSSEQKLSAEERDNLRAEIILAKLSDFCEPDFHKLPPGPESQTSA